MERYDELFQADDLIKSLTRQLERTQSKLSNQPVFAEHNTESRCDPFEYSQTLITDATALRSTVQSQSAEQRLLTTTAVASQARAAVPRARAKSVVLDRHGRVKNGNENAAHSSNPPQTQIERRRSTAAPRREDFGSSACVVGTGSLGRRPATIPNNNLANYWVRPDVPKPKQRPPAQSSPQKSRGERHTKVYQSLLGSAQWPAIQRASKLSLALRSSEVLQDSQSGLQSTRKQQGHTSASRRVASVPRSKSVGARRDTGSCRPDGTSRRPSVDEGMQTTSRWQVTAVPQRQQQANAQHAMRGQMEEEQQQLSRAVPSRRPSTAANCSRRQSTAANCSRRPSTGAGFGSSVDCRVERSGTSHASNTHGHGKKPLGKQGRVATQSTSRRAAGERLKRSEVSAGLEKQPDSTRRVASSKFEERLWHDGRSYYFNPTNGKHQWQQPAEGSYTPCQSCWLQRLDPASERYYYLNWQSKAVCWTVPNEGFEHIWQEQREKRTGGVYFLNCLTKEKSSEPLQSLSEGGPGYRPLGR